MKFKLTNYSYGPHLAKGAAGLAEKRQKEKNIVGRIRPRWIGDVGVGIVDGLTQ